MKYLSHWKFLSISQESCVVKQFIYLSVCAFCCVQKCRLNMTQRQKWVRYLCFCHVYCIYSHHVASPDGWTSEYASESSGHQIQVNKSLYILLLQITLKFFFFCSAFIKKLPLELGSGSLLPQIQACLKNFFVLYQTDNGTAKKLNLVYINVPHLQIYKFILLKSVKKLLSL